jgi:hypothetical protein
MKKLPGTFILLATATLLFFSLTPAQAVGFHFERFTASAPVDYSAQFTLNVTDEGVNPGQVKFTISSEAGGVGEIAQIYFYDGDLRSGVAPIIQNSPPAIEFTQPSTPKDVPSGENIGLKTSGGGGTGGAPGAWFSVMRTGSDSGVNADESVSFVFTLPTGNTVQGVVADLNRWIDLPLADKKTLNWNVSQPDYLALALHVQELPDGNGGNTSDSFAIASTPLPASVLLLGSGLLGLGAVGWRRRKKA